MDHEPTPPAGRRPGATAARALAWGVALGVGAGAAGAVGYFTPGGNRLPEVGEAAAVGLAAVAAGAVAGAIVGPVVWLMRPRAPVPWLRLFFTRGLAGAACLLLVLALVWAALGGIKGASIGPAGPGVPGVRSAFFAASMALFVGGLPVGLAGFLIGGCVALLVRGAERTPSVRE